MLYRMDPQSAVPKAFSTGGLAASVPTWSRDGYIYFIDTSAPVVNMEPSGISRINPDQGKIEPIVTTLRRAIFPLPMPDGNGLIYAANPTTAELGLWWRPPNGGLDRLFLLLLLVQRGLLY